MATKKNTAAKTAVKEETKKATTAVKETAKKVAEATKETAKKTETVTKAAADKAEKTTKSVAEKAEKATKAVAEKTAKATKETAKKAEKAIKETAKKAEKAADKKPAQKTAPKKEDAQVYFEFGGKQFDPAVVAENVKKAYVSAGHKASSIKSLKVYIKAEDNAAYFVINNKETGKIVL